VHGTTSELPLAGEPRVRIHLSPAESLQTFGLAGIILADDDAERERADPAVKAGLLAQIVKDRAAPATAIGKPASAEPFATSAWPRVGAHRSRRSCGSNSGWRTSTAPFSRSQAMSSKTSATRDPDRSGTGELHQVA